MTVTAGASLRRTAFYGINRLRGRDYLRELRQIDRVMRQPTVRRSFQEDSLRILMADARKTQHYSEINATELEDFPVLGKWQLKENPDSFLQQDFDPKLVSVSTSGSYGVPLTFQLSPTKKFRQLAEVIYFGELAGYSVGDRHLYVRAHYGKNRLKLWAQNERFAQTDTPDAAWVLDQIDQLKRHHIQAIIGFPSVIRLLAQEAMLQGNTPQDFQISSVICTGETLREEQRTEIEAAFGAPCLSRYSSEETGVMAGECPHRKLHHVNEAGYVVELLELDRDIPVREGGTGRVIVTDLFSNAMPLIRYDTGDLATEGPPCSCGLRTGTLSSIEGRVVEVLNDTSGRPLTPFFINPLMKDFRNVRQFQVAQLSNTSYEMRVVGTLTTTETSSLKRRLESKFGTNATVNIIAVNDIQALPSGKRPYVVDERNHP